jgi:CheY-like chemotaxis protein
MNEQPGITACPKLSILAVDDGPEMDSTETMLAGLYALDVRIARGIDEALEALDSAWPDVVMLSVRAPASAGYAVAMAIRERSRERKLPYLVALSDQESQDARRRARVAGMHFFLVRPVDPSMLRKLFVVMAKSPGGK